MNLLNFRPLQIFLFCIVIFLLWENKIFSQSYGEKYSIKLTAIIDDINPKINLEWDSVSNAMVINIYRKHKEDTLWGNPLAVISPFSISYEDTTVNLSTSYEYKIFADRSTYPDGYGYINSGIKLDPMEYRGTLALIIDSTFLGQLDQEIEQYISDLTGDGWNVIPQYVARTESPISVKARILKIHAANPDLTTLYLLGHIPVPYSGFLVPDGHTNNHYGAWPADGYYADLDGIWTDTINYNSVYGSSRQQNLAGDGKFDQSSYPSDLELSVGRVDMYDLPNFNESEIELIRNYLSKNHDYRFKKINTIERALIDDNFAAYSEGFSGNGYRNFPPLVDKSNVVEGDYFNDLNAGSYILSYGCGGGNYTGANGIGNTNSFVNNSPNGIFTILFGSYFGDWDVSNNFLRAALGSGTILTNCWAGRPNWYFHHMGLGETIGFSTRSSQNNTSSRYYPTGSYPGYVHMALMGDPTLRFHVVAPPEELIAIDQGDNIALSWTASADPDIDCYFVYRSTKSAGPYERIAVQSITNTTYTDTTSLEGDNYYMVRAHKLQKSASGSYYNLSQGIFASVTCLTVNIKVFLEGCYDMDTTGLMTTFLNLKPGSLLHRGLLPGQTPIDTTFPPTPTGHPFGGSPWNYVGSDDEKSLTPEYTVSVTDWVLVSFREHANDLDAIKQFAGLLHNDGTIEIFDDCKVRIDSETPESLYALVEHRNHMGIMTPDPVTIERGTYSFDFTVQDSYVNGTIGYGQKKIAPGVFAMYCGDLHHTPNVSFDINGQDKALWDVENGMFKIYTPSDLNLSGEVSGADIIFWRKNNGTFSVIPK